jgi:hypothetical protein
MQFSNFLIKDIEIIKKLAPNSLNFEHDGNYIYLFSYIFATKIAFFADLYFIF